MDIDLIPKQLGLHKKLYVTSKDQNKLINDIRPDERQFDIERFLPFIAAIHGGGACGRIDETRLHGIMRGIVHGCEIAGCSLGGGETAEMPDLYGEEDFDLAGFAVGIAEQDGVLPLKEEIRTGDLVLGLRSSGIHSNGLSLARKVIPESDSAAWEEMLIPTLIYTREMGILLETGQVLAAAHVTGGGLYGNLQRVIPDSLAPRFTFDWKVPPLFGKIQAAAGFPTRRCGPSSTSASASPWLRIPAQRTGLIDLAQRSGFDLLEIGVLQ